jgi:hypothetical protein
VTPAPDLQPQITTSTPLSLEHYAASVEGFLQRHKLAVVAVLSVLYFGGTILRARGKPFWFDELLTILAARQPTYSATLQAARELDLTPPLTDLVAHTMDRLAGSGEVVFRLPAMIGFWIFCLCLFGFASRRVNMFFALSAMLLPFVTSGESYSFEARSYGMMLGFCGIALWSWQTAALGKNRVGSVLGLMLGIGGAVACHYYAVLIYLPLAGAEAFRSARLRKIDKAIWAAFVAGAIPLLWSLLWVIRVAKANQHPVIHATRQDYLVYYVSVFGNSLWFLIPALVLCAAWLLAGGNEAKPESSDPPRIPDYELLAATLFLLLPVAAITLALIVPPHLFVDRYALPSIGGFALVTAFIAAHFAGKRLAPGIAFALPVFLVFLFVMAHGRQPLESPLQKEPLLTVALQRGPVAVNDYVSYLQLWYYAPADERSRLLYLSDEDSAVKYSHIDDIMQPFRKFGVPVVSYEDFATPGKKFLLYFTRGFGWVPERVLDDGGSVQVINWAQGKALLEISVK